MELSITWAHHTIFLSYNIIYIYIVSLCIICIYIYMYHNHSGITFLLSADPGLRQGRGGAWDHRRCGACFCWLATTLPSARHSGHCPLLLRALLLKAFKPAVCHLKRCTAASSRHSRHCPLLLRAFKPAVCQASNA